MVEPHSVFIVGRAQAVISVGTAGRMAIRLPVHGPTEAKSVHHRMTRAVVRFQRGVVRGFRGVPGVAKVHRASFEDRQRAGVNVVALVALRDLVQIIDRHSRGVHAHR